MSASVADEAVCVGECGRRSCVVCGEQARAAAVAVEAAAQDAPAGADGGSSTIVEMTVFGRTVRVEARDSLDRVSAAALRLWGRLEEPGRVPLGTSGFVMSDPGGPPPLEMEARLPGLPWEEADGGRAA